MSTSTASPRRRWGGDHPAPDGRLPELLRACVIMCVGGCPGSTRSSTLTTPPIIGLIGTLLSDLKGTRTSTGAWTCTPTPAWRWGGCRAAIPGRRWPWLSDWLYRQADRVVVLGPYMADRIACQGGRSGPDRDDPGLEPPRRDLPAAARGPPASRATGAGREVRRDVLGQLGPGPFVRRVPRGGPAAAATATTSSSCSSATARGGRRLCGRARARGWRTSACSTTSRASSCISLSVADVHLISMRPEMTGICVPGKLYGVMASGRPVVFVGPGIARSPTRFGDHGCGEVVAPDDGAALARVLEALADDAAIGVEHGERGLQAFQLWYEREPCCAAWYGLLDEMANPEPGEPVKREPGTSVRPLPTSVPDRVRV